MMTSKVAITGVLPRDRRPRTLEVDSLAEMKWEATAAFSGTVAQVSRPENGSEVSQAVVHFAIVRLQPCQEDTEIR